MKKKKKFSFRAFVFFALFTGIFCYLFNSSSKIVLNIGVNYYRSKIMTVSYEAIGQCFNEKSELENVITIEKDNDNNINYVSCNSYKLNLLTSSLSTKFKEYFNKAFSDGVAVPMGAFSGLSIFSGFGKEVKMDLIVITSVKCEFYSEFQEAGINQTRHIMKLFIIPTASIISHRKTFSQTEKIEVILYDNLIIGKVPAAYLNGNVLK